MTTLLLATRKGLFVAERASHGFRIARTAFLGDPVSQVLADPRDDTWYAALDHGHFGVKLHRSENRGETWTEIAAPAYPPKPESGAGSDDRINWSTALIWSLEAALDQPGAIWAGTVPGGLFRSEDRGATWQLNTALWNEPSRGRWMGAGNDQPGLHTIVVDPRDPRRVALAISTGGIWRTDDGGATWQSRAKGFRSDYTPPDQEQDPIVQDVHRIVQCAAEPTHFWAQHHNGIFRSTDDLASWTEIKAGETTGAPSLFGFPVVVHPRDPNTAWFVPARKDQWRYAVDGALSVSRTRDGGKSFTALRNGLPQEHAYDLVYRHALAIAPDGDTLAFGSTTGNVFTSGNGGDQWHCLSHHLPPVYAVRFV